MSLQEQWLDAICLSKLICEKCEDAHLNSHGEQFYASHELFADIQEKVHDFADDVCECFYGARGLPFPSSNQILKRMNTIIPVESDNVQILARQIKDLIISLIDVLTSIEDSDDSSLGDGDLTANTCKNLQQKIYFLNRFLA